jgi:hypothetical protein
MGLDSDGFMHRYYEVKPIAGAWLETISGKRWTIRYGSGTQRDPFPVAPRGQLRANFTDTHRS